MAMTLERLMEVASNYAKAYNNKEKKSTLKALKKMANEACNTYNLELSKATYRQWAKEGDAVKTAIRSLYVPNAQRLSFKTDDDDYMTVVLSDTQYEVNLPQMQATLGAGVFADSDWFNKCEKLAFIVANALNEHLNDSAMFNFNIAEASKEFSFPKGIDPLSDEGVVHALQCVFDSILFIPENGGENGKSKSKKKNAGENLIKTRVKEDKRGVKYSVEWQYIRESMTQNGGVGVVTVCNTGKFTSYILHAMHLILTSGNIRLACDGDYTMPETETDNVASSVTEEATTEA